MRHPVILLALLLGCGLSSCNIIPSATVTPRLASLELDGDLLLGVGGVSGSGDLETLGLGDSESTFAPRVDLSWGPVDLVATAYNSSFSGEGVADVTLDLGGTTITAGDTVRSDLDLSSLGLLAIWDFVPTDLVDFGLGLGVQLIDISASVESIGLGAGTIETDESAPFPVLAARAAVQVFDLELVGVASGVSFETGGIDATYYDLDLMASYTFERFLGFHGALVAGWRQIVVDAEYTDQGSDVILDFTLSGPFFGLSLGL